MTRKSKVIMVVLSCGLAMLSGCCTIMSGSTQQLPVTSEPAGARVTADNGTTITTPGSLTLKRKEAHTLVAELPGHKPQQQKLEKKLNNWIWGNILFGGIIGIVIDFVSGSVDELHPKEVHFNFKGASKEGASAIPFRYNEMLIEKGNELRYLKICRNAA